MVENKEHLITKRIWIYLVLVLGFLFGCFLLAVILPEEKGKAVYQFLAVFFTAVPVIGALITRRLTCDKTSLHIDLHVWKNWKMWLFSAFVPGIAILLGMITYYLVFPTDLDYSATYILEHYAGYGLPETLQLTNGSILRAGIVTVFIAAIFFPLQLFELGEEIGWRGYLLPLLCEKMSARKATLLNGVLWGIAHAPLVYFGFNYGLNYVGAPWMGIVMMTLVGIVIGVWTSYVMLKTGNCMYAAIIHGVVNIIGETGVFVSLGTCSTLLGPNPTGIIGMSLLIIGAIILWIRMKKLPVCNGDSIK